MLANSKRKKELGAWGEKILDEWMKQNNWNPIHKNLRIKNGEIDRTYFHINKRTQLTQFCIVEIKTSLFYKVRDVEILFTETGVKRYLRQRQILNLYRYGENLLALLKHKKYSGCRVYLRFFIILKCAYNLSGLNLENLPSSTAIKNCYQGENYFIFSIEPEFTGINSRKSLLQVKIN